jgi:Na+/phosphate symporter
MQDDTFFAYKGNTLLEGTPAVILLLFAIAMMFYGFGRLLTTDLPKLISKI